jgi:hypothetical protein
MDGDERNNLYPSPSPVLRRPEKRRDEFLVIAVAKCILIGTGVGLAGIPVCFLVLLPILAFREVGLLLLLVLIPVGIYTTSVAARRYLAARMSCSRAAMAWALRYAVIGAGIAMFLKLFVVAGEISDTPIIIFCGSVIGTVCGSLGGAFHGWLRSRQQGSPSPDDAPRNGMEKREAQ